MPILVVDGPDDEPMVVMEVVRFMSSLTTQGESLSKMQGIATVLGMLHDFVQLKWDKAVEPESLPDVVAAFLRQRRSGADEELGWESVKRETVDRDRHYLRLYSEFCADRFRYFPLVPSKPYPIPAGGRDYKKLLLHLKGRGTMLLAHLIPTHGAPIRSSVNIAEKTVKRRSSGKTYMSKAMVEDLIMATKSVSQRLVFIQAAFGGQRISEILNQWRCDVLPGRFRPVLFPDDVASDVPLIVLAHPSQSRYVGEVRAGTNDRLQHLFRNYRLTPRNLLDGDPMEAGWKGMLFDNEDMLISQVFWADRSWAKIHYELFQQQRDRLLPLVPDEVRKSHPYLIINDDRRREEFGMAMKMSNIRKAFERACRRIGVDPDRFPKAIHGLRHSYKSFLEDMGMDPEEVRKAMHHISVESQQEYAQSAKRLNERLMLISENN